MGILSRRSVFASAAGFLATMALKVSALATDRHTSPDGLADAIRRMKAAERPYLAVSRVGDDTPDAEVNAISDRYHDAVADVCREIASRSGRGVAARSGDLIAIDAGRILDVHGEPSRIVLLDLSAVA